MFDKNDDRPLLRLKKEHQNLADELQMTPWEYLCYRAKIDKLEERRQLEELRIAPRVSYTYTDFINNFDNLGYSKHFLTKDDAEFVYDRIEQWEDENSYIENLIDRLDSKEDDINTLKMTGVKYCFKNIDITIYSTFNFVQSDGNDHSSSLEYGHELYLYNHRTDLFTEILKDDYTEIFFSRNT